MGCCADDDTVLIYIRCMDGGIREGNLAIVVIGKIVDFCEPSSYVIGIVYGLQRLTFGTPYFFLDEHTQFIVFVFGNTFFGLIINFLEMPQRSLSSIVGKTILNSEYRTATGAFMLSNCQVGFAPKV